MRRLLPLFLVLLLLGAATFAGLWQQYQRFLHTPLVISNEQIILQVERGSGIRAVVEELQRRQVTSMDWRWRLLSRLQPVTIKTGEYLLTKGLSPPGLLDLLSSGKVVTYRFTIIEGWTTDQFLTALAADTVLLKTISPEFELQTTSGLPAGHPEGWFLPETYTYERGDSDVSILHRAHQAMQQALDRTWAGRETGLPYETAYELLIMASIIERETSQDDERTIIAGVFVRRLLKKWRLETDPTVIYGMGAAYQGNIRRRDLKTDNPYNTYTRHGLPPTPISLPGLASLRAAAHPDTSEVMFFVANGQGGHTFSVTLDEHNKAVRKMLKDKQDQQK